MVKEAVILAGGLGTRLDRVVNDVPKPMARVSGRPFLEYLLDYVIAQNVKRAILAVGFKHEVIKKHFGKRYKGLDLIYSIEEDPLGTGGAIKKALDFLEEESFLILNGDTFFNIPLEKLNRFHKLKGADVSLALRLLRDSSRYGNVEVNADGRLVRFLEKGERREGLINGGVYILHRIVLSRLAIPNGFSLEKEVLEQYVKSFRFYGFPFNDFFFIDIGIPEDYARAQNELTREAEKMLPQRLGT